MLNHPDVATLLLQRGANAQSRQRGTGNVALHEAAINGNLECIQVGLQNDASSDNIIHEFETSHLVDIDHSGT